MNDLAGHYSRLASSYDRLWTVDADFVEDTAAAIVAALDLGAGDRFVDLGGGTGLHAAAIAARVGFRQPPLVVDPSPDLLAQVPAGPLRTREDDAAGFSRRPEPFDKLLMKEMIHHVEPGQRRAVLAELAAAVSPGGRLLVVMLPQRIDHPLFAAALARFEAVQPDPRDVAAELAAAGLEVSLTHVDRPLSVERERYATMVRGRYMSLLAAFDDEELEAGIAELLAAHPEPELRYTYRLAFVAAAA